MTAKKVSYDEYKDMKFNVRLLTDNINDVERYKNKVSTYQERVVELKKKIPSIDERIRELWVESDVNSTIFNARTRIKKFRFGNQILDVNSEDFHDVQIAIKKEEQSLYDEKSKFEREIRDMESVIKSVNNVGETIKKLATLKERVAEVEKENPIYVCEVPKGKR